MGREIHRVPLDFKWPLNKVWAGFINPHCEKCPACNAYGVSPEGKRLEDFVRRLVLAAEASVERPEGYTPRPMMSFAETLRRVRAKLGWRNPTNDDVFKAHKEVTHECEGALSVGSFLGGLQAMQQGIDPDGPDTSPPKWPFTADPVEVLTSLTGQPISEEHAWIIRRIAGVVPAKSSYSPRLIKRVWSEPDEKGQRTRKHVIDPNGEMYYPHPYLCEEDGIGDVGPDFYKVIEALPGVEKDGFLGHYRNTHWTTIKAIMTAMNVTKEGWYHCQTCGGDGSPEHIRYLRDAWKPTPVPEGPAYQLWEHVSEGSPQSPPFATPEELADWLAAHYEHPRQERAAWLRFINGPGWAPSGIGHSGGPIEDGVTVMSRET